MKGDKSLENQLYKIILIIQNMSSLNNYFFFNLNPYAVLIFRLLNIKKSIDCNYC